MDRRPQSACGSATSDNPLDRDPKHESAAEIVRLASKLVRLQSRLEDGASQRSAAAGDGRHAAIRSGIEVLRGVAVSMIGEMTRSIERDAFHYVFQPIACATSGRIEAYEALLRWRRGSEVLCPPLFLPLAEEARLLATIQQGLLHQIAELYGRLPVFASINLNWSPAQLSDHASVSAFIDRVRELGITPSRMAIEITECAAMAAPELALASIMRLKEQGFRIALDDFGSGYCSFAYLTRLPIDIVKIDRSLIKELGSSARATTILDGIVDTAHRLGQQVVAEGVETPQQLAAVRRLGCEFVQGNLTGPPVASPLTGQ